MLDSRKNYYVSMFRAHDVPVDASRVLGMSGLSRDELKAEFEKNSDLFQNLVYGYGLEIGRGKVTNVTYARIVYAVAQFLGLGGVQVYMTVLLDKKSKTHDKDYWDFQDRKSAGDDHPFVHNHVYVQRGSKVYELWGKETEGFTHLDDVLLF